MGSKLDPPHDDQTPTEFSKETIGRIAVETGVPENIVNNIIATDERKRSAEEVRDMILDLFQERGTSDLEPLDQPRQGHTTSEDAVGKLERLRNMLAREPEFEARYPEAYKELFTPPHRDIGSRHPESTGLPLPSFGARVLRSDPKSMLQSERPEQLADAYSATSLHREMGEIAAPRSPLPVVKGYLRGILLAVMSREEYSERIDPSRRYTQVPKGLADLIHREESNIPRRPGVLDLDMLRRPYLSESDGSGVPEGSLVRLTDLRLAFDLPHQGLKAALIPVLGSLERPLTPEGVVEWKREKSEEFARELERMERRLSDREPQEAEAKREEKKFEELTRFMAAISFTTAALCLFLDLGLPGVREASDYRLGEQVEALASIVWDLKEDLDRGTDKLESLVANRGAGRPPSSEEELYTALVRYRLGEASLEDLATELGITPYDSRTAKGTRSWKKRTKQKIAWGADVEKRYYPRAAGVLTNKHNRHVRDKAIRAYRKYLAEREGIAGFYPWVEVAREIRTNPQTQRGMEITMAYVQLGSCLERGSTVRLNSRRG